jgi:subtilisin family serine protease
VKEHRPKKHLCTLLFTAFLITSLCLSIPTASTNNVKLAKAEKTAIQPAASYSCSNQPYEPTMSKPAWTDKNNNCIEDTLDEEITQRTLNKTQDQNTNVIVTLKTKPTNQDAETFTQHGGSLTTELLTYAIYGFGGKIPYNQIPDYAKSNTNILLIEEDQTCYAQIAYAAQQTGTRPYVWNTLGLQGDPQSSIAIIDTGIDDSHTDFSPGYGNLNFTNKIIGWNDFIASSATPYDDNGHGSHVAGLAAGNGFFSTDESGNAVATWGANLGKVDTTGTYLISGMMVNRTGPITVNVKWTNTATRRQSTLSALQIYNGSKSLSTGAWTKLAEVSTPTKETWYTLTYNVPSTPTGGYDMYHITMTLTAGTQGNLYIVFTVSWPYTPPSDGFSAWTGIAPQTKLVSVKALDYSGGGSSTGLLNAINWIIANRQAYHIVTVSMSLGFTSEVSTVDNAVVNLVNSGITTVISAGNSGSGSNYIYTPGSVDEAITVAATNQFDNIADYSSQGGTSRYTGKTIKPDVATPGGSFFAVPLLSADSNDNDGEGKWTEINWNDSALMQGTSMSAPIVAGAASIVIQALGGFSSWQWTRTQALQPKMILLMTATETYPNVREYDTSYSPTLERGGKDVHEGYGRLNLDVAVDALLKTLEVGTIATDTLGKPPAINDISVLGQKLAWARKVQLNTQGKCNFTLTVPSGADFDLYLYNSTGTSYGEPAIVAKSTNATTGGQEQIILNAPYNGTYYLVVKRATANTLGGTFTLESAFTPNHEVTVLEVEPSSATVYEGNKLNITVTVKNKGLNMESFNVTAFYNSTSFGEQTVSNLPAGTESLLNFTWDTLGVIPNYYLVEAQAQSVPHEYNSTDNTLAYEGLVHVKILGDVNGDGSVAASDLVQLNTAYGSYYASANWNAECDFNQDRVVNIVDLHIFGKNFGRTG